VCQAFSELVFFRLGRPRPGPVCLQQGGRVASQRLGQRGRRHRLLNDAEQETALPQQALLRRARLPAAWAGIACCVSSDTPSEQHTVETCAT
jgi:hypothetical protein